MSPNTRLHWCNDAISSTLSFVAEFKEADRRGVERRIGQYSAQDGKRKRRLIITYSADDGEVAICDGLVLTVWDMHVAGISYRLEGLRKRSQLEQQWNRGRTYERIRRGRRGIPETTGKPPSGGSFSRQEK